MIALNFVTRRTSRLLAGRHFQRAVVVVFVVLITGCVGTKLLDEPTLLPERNSLATVRDAVMAATLDWVIVRDGPGTWAKNADWDEYLLRLENRSTTNLRITEVYIEDSMGIKVFPGRDRKRLIAGSKQVAERYKDADIKIKAGTGTAVMVTRAALFFPISPSPRHIVISYRQGESIQTLRLETRESLAGLHLGTASVQ